MAWLDRAFCRVGANRKVCWGVSALADSQAALDLRAALCMRSQNLAMLASVFALVHGFGIIHLSMPHEKQFHRVASVTEIPLHSGQTVWVGKQAIALFHLDGGFYALDDRCPHRGASLGDGMLAGERVLCPWHLFDFDLPTGKCGAVSGLDVATYVVKVEGDDVFVLV